jgi:hypothetical protein
MAAAGLLRTDQLATTVRNWFKRIQYGSRSSTGFLPKPGSASNLNRQRHQTPVFQPLQLSRSVGVRGKRGA